MGGPIELKGPDLAMGAALADVPDGGSLLGHARGEPVLVVRRADTLFAVGAVCSHYSGPLAEGIVVGDTVRCPWHHACFDLRTGAAERARVQPHPLLRVERRGDRLVVGEKRPDRAARRGRRPGARRHRRRRARGGDGRGDAASLRPRGPDRPRRRRGHAAGRPAEPLQGLPRGHGARGVDGAARRGLLPRAAHRAPRRRARRRRSTSRRARSRSRAADVLPWDALVLATGAEPVRLALPGAERLHVHPAHARRQPRHRRGAPSRASARS